MSTISDPSGRRCNWSLHCTLTACFLALHLIRRRAIWPVFGQLAWRWKRMLKCVLGACLGSKGGKSKVFSKISPKNLVQSQQTTSFNIWVFMFKAPSGCKKTKFKKVPEVFVWLTSSNWACCSLCVVFLVHCKSCKTDLGRLNSSDLPEVTRYLIWFQKVNFCLVSKTFLFLFVCLGLHSLLAGLQFDFFDFEVSNIFFALLFTRSFSLSLQSPFSRTCPEQIATVRLKWTPRWLLFLCLSSAWRSSFMPFCPIQREFSSFSKSHLTICLSSLFSFILFLFLLDYASIGSLTIFLLKSMFATR